VTILTDLARAKIAFQQRTIHAILTENPMTDTPNPADFSVKEKPNEYRATFEIRGSVEVTLNANSEDHAARLAEEFADNLASGIKEVELDEVADIAVSYVRKTPPMYRVTQDGKKMQVSRLSPGHLPREPDERGF